MSEKKYSYQLFSENDEIYIKSLCVIICFFITIMMAFSPLISAILSIFILLLMGRWFSKKVTVWLSFLAITSVILIYSSRGFYPLWDGTDDVNVYYENYKSLLDCDYSAFFKYGGGLEVGLPLYLYLIGEIFGDITRNQLLIVVGFPVGVALIYWFYSSPAKLIPLEYHALLLGGMVVIYSYSASNLLLRQFFASVILLYAVSSKDRITSCLLLILSASFHITSILFYLAYRIYIKRRGDYLFFVVFILSFLSLSYLSDMLSLIGMHALSLKLSYYSLGGMGTQDIDSAISLNKATLIILCIGLFYISSSIILSSIVYRRIESVNRHARIIFFMLICTLMSMHLAWFPTRLFLIPVYFLMPLMLFHAIKHRSYTLMQIIFIILLFQRISSWVSVGQSYTELWVGYDWWSPVPFYYLF